MKQFVFVNFNCRLLHLFLGLLSMGILISFPVSSDVSNLNEMKPTDNVMRLEYERPRYLKFPEGSPYSPQIAALGKLLFFDPRLSSGQNMSCATCHNPSFGWETPASKAIGASNISLDRHVPTIINLADAPHLFWDGRSKTLEEQAKIPITNPLEMGMPMVELIERLTKNQTYQYWFARLFPDEGLTQETLVRAIATFERTIESGWSSFDDWVAGNEDAISSSAKAGFALFTGKAGCSNCHTGWSFTDHKFHDIGLPAQNDLGRFSIDPSDIDNKYAFKTPTLRNISLRAPYMHNGVLSSLNTVLNHYIGGGIRRESRSSEIAPLPLSVDEKTSILDFLQTLTEDNLNVSTPVLPAL